MALATAQSPPDNTGAHGDAVLKRGVAGLRRAARRLGERAKGGGSSNVFVAGSSSSPNTRAGDGQVIITLDPSRDRCLTLAGQNRRW